jgi:hypothetical protein
MLDMIALAGAQHVVGFMASTFSWYLREVRCLLGSPISVSPQPPCYFRTNLAGKSTQIMCFHMRPIPHICQTGHMQGAKLGSRKACCLAELSGSDRQAKRIDSAVEMAPAFM